MAQEPEAAARAEIDRLLMAAGWAVQDLRQADIHAARGVAIREFQLNTGFGKADYLLYVDGKPDHKVDNSTLVDELERMVRTQLEKRKTATGLDAIPIKRVTP